ncbi:MAG: tetratricopeptide repeat protein [Rickettsiales bacterium]
MALIKCKDCGKEFSSDAKNCIHCGANKPKERVRTSWSFLASVFGFMFLIAISGNSGKSSKNNSYKTMEEENIVNRDVEQQSDKTHNFANTVWLAERGDVEAQSILCVAYYRGVKDNYDEMVKISKENLPASISLGIGFLDENIISGMYNFGTTIKSDFVKSGKWCKAAAEQGDKIGSYFLSDMYESECCGFDKNKKLSLEWLMKAAKLGVASAQARLAQKYMNGEDVPKNYKKSLYWYLKAAKQGQSIAQTRLGFIYKEGKAVPIDYKKSIEWFEKSARSDKFFGTALFQLGKMYMLGEGVPSDFVKAYMYISILASKGLPEAKQLLDILENKMTLAQIEKAQSLAKNWKAEGNTNLSTK